MYTVYTDIKGYNTAADAAARKNPFTTIKKGEYHMFYKYPNGYNGMYNITTNPSVPGSWINPADNKKPDDIEQLKKENAELSKKVANLEAENKTLKSKISAAQDALK